MTAAIPEDVRAAILTDYARGMTGPDVARTHGVGVATVYRVASGVARGRKFPDHVLDAAVQDYLDSCESIRAVAARHPLSEDTLRTELKARELTRPSGATTPTSVKNGAIDDYLAGMTIADVADRHGVARSTVSAWLEDRGLDRADRIGESPDIYKGGWVRDGLVWRPRKPTERMAA